MQRSSFILSVVLSAVCGALLGATLTAYQVHAPSPISIMDDVDSDVPVVRIDGIENYALTGTAEGNVRISAGGEIVALDENGHFTIDDRSILINRITVQAPAGMLFVASSKGSKYYAVDSSAGQNIVPANRVYFASAAAAEAAGYRK